MRMLQQGRVQDWSFVVLDREVGEEEGRNELPLLYISDIYLPNCLLH